MPRLRMRPADRNAGHMEGINLPEQAIAMHQRMRDGCRRQSFCRGMNGRRIEATLEGDRRQLLVSELP
jgi:hypothetical protein